MQASLFHEPERVIYREPLRPVVTGGESKIRLRSSQAPAMQMARDRIRGDVKRGIIAACCAFGKSVVACAFIEAAIKKGSKVWFVVDRQILVNDMSKKLDSYGIDHAVMMSGHERWDKSHRVQVVSIQTAEKRGWDGDIDMMIVDECHSNMRKSFISFVRSSPKTVVIGLTATPFHKEIGSIYQFVVNPTTTNKQIEEGFVVPLQIYSCVEADMKGAKKVGGEYTDSEVAGRGSKIIGDIVSTWHEKTMEHYGKPVKTIVFTADCAHGAEICEAFQAAGFNFQQITHKDDKDDRDDKINEMRREDSNIIGLVSCGVLTRGFDLTDIQIGIMARPLRKAFSEFIQQAGRVQRAHTWPDGTKKEYGLLLDHCSNVACFLPEMLDLFENGVSDLSDPPDAKPPRKELTKKEKKEIFCPKCQRLWTGKSDTCVCGYKRKRASTAETVPGRMQKVDATGKGKKKAEPTRQEKERFYAMAMHYGTTKGWKPGAAFHKYEDKFGVKPSGMRDVVPIPPDAGFMTHMQNLARKASYAKRRA